MDTKFHYHGVHRYLIARLQFPRVQSPGPRDLKLHHVVLVLHTTVQYTIRPYEYTKLSDKIEDSDYQQSRTVYARMDICTFICIEP